MAGFPGSGKSTLAREIAIRTSAIIVDHDISKSSLLNSLRDESIEQATIGKMAYDMDWSLIEFYLAQGKDVIFDSPCLYEVMVEKAPP